MSTPLISILLPAYQSERYVGETIESALAQTFTDWELVISENASTDKTLEIIKQYNDPRIRLFCQEKTSSPAENWQFTFDKAIGEFACVLGADDVFEPNHLERKVNLLLKFPEAPFIHGAVQFIDENGTKIKIYEQNVSFEESPKAFLSRILHGNPVITHTTLFRLSEAKRKNINFDLRFTILMDWHFWMELALNTSGNILYDSEITMKYRMHPQNTTSQQRRGFIWAIETAELQLDLLNRYTNRWREIGVNPEVEQKQISRGLWALAFQQLRRRNVAQAKRAWKNYRNYHSVGEMLCDVPAHYWNRLTRR